MDKREKTSRQDFYRRVGKSPEDEGRDSTRALGLVFIIGIVAVVAVVSYAIFYAPP